jgi:intracellular sulfur oxidation DsrE/DsrF family protein
MKPTMDAGRRRFVAGSIAAAVAAGWAGSATSQSPQAAAGKKYKAIVHVTDGEPDKWNRVLGFVRGLESTGEKGDLAITVVVQGLATDMLKADSPVAKGVSDAIGRGVEVVACEYSMATRKVTREEMNRSVVSYVPFGGMEIIKREGQGWAYLRP